MGDVTHTRVFHDDMTLFKISQMGTEINHFPALKLEHAI
jgi:hypothetical protein